VTRSPRLLWLLGLTAALGALLFIWRLGSIGQVDETPALFAAAGRAMADSGDWLTPRVNGHPRFDKPVLIYWLIGGLSLLPRSWDPLGSWAASLPSALAMVGVMLALVLTVARAGGPGQGDPWKALSAGLAFALSPLVLIWGRVSVSDPLLSACLAVALLGFWRSYARARRGWPWASWLALGLAALTKGPVALVLAFGTLASFGWLQQDLRGLQRALAPSRGLALSLAVALPWYGLEWAREGKPFWDSFFGYHNLQRFTQVVNNHAGPWWFYLPVVVIASLPVTPLLLLGLGEAFQGVPQRRPLPPAASLQRFALCWLAVVIGLFSLSATKLASYLLPGLPAIALLVALAGTPSPWLGRARWGSVALAALLGAGLGAAALWVPLIHDPEMPGMAAQLLASGAVQRSGACFLLAAMVGAGILLGSGPGRTGVGPGWLLALQAPLILWQPLGLQPIAELGDQIRQQPVRQIAAAVDKTIRAGEPLAMVGVNKPSLHYYTRQVVIYEGRPATGLRNLSERLSGQSPTLLMVIDSTTAALPYWRSVPHGTIAQFGIYQLWRVSRPALNQRALGLVRQGIPSTWRLPNPERY
jgi:4-amino-4-deoxy-L-arabinose transferase-like glycosyltransferase